MIATAGRWWHAEELAHRTRDMRTGGGSLRRIAIACAIVAALVVGFGTVLSARRSSADVASLYTAHWMLATAHGTPHPGGAINSGRPPGYALILTGLAQALPGTRAGLACWQVASLDCRVSELPLVVAVQWLVALGILGLLYRLGRQMSGEAEIALIAAVLAFLSLRLGEFAGLLRPHVWYALALALYLTLAVDTMARRSWLALAGAGAALAMACLIEPVTIVLAPVTALQLWRAPGPTGTGRRGPASAMVFAGAVGLAVLGLMAIAGRLGFAVPSTVTHVLIALAQRLAFVGIERASQLAIAVTSVPIIGDLVMGVLPALEVKRISIGAAPGSLLAIGSGELMPDALARSGQSAAAAIGLLLRERVAGHPVAYVGSIAPMLLRGLFAGGGIIALIGLGHVPAMLRLARAGGRLGVHGLVLLPVAVLLVANALVTPNSFWSNPMLPFVYAYAIAYVAAGW